MKFRFCGELDAPDWILKEITVLSSISMVRMRLLSIQIINQLLGGNIDWERVGKLMKDFGKSEVLTSYINPFLETSDVKASIAALQWILTNGFKYNVDEETLSNELQQLGLPKEHCVAIRKPYRNNKDKVRAVFADSSLKLPRLQSVDWRVDYLLSSSSLQELNTPSIQLKLNISDINSKEPTVVAFDLTAEKFRVLLNELRSAREAMDTVTASN